MGQWRGRCLLADQLVYLCQMFPAEVVTSMLVPVVHRLLRDKVSAVRIAATRPVRCLSLLMCANTGCPACIGA